MYDYIRAQGLTKDYKEGKGIFDFSFSVKKGEVFGIVGTNGSGKTTTLRHLMGFISPDSGSCSVMGLDCRKDSKEIMKHVGYVPGEIDFPDVGSGTSFLKIQAGFLGVRDREYIHKLCNMFGLDPSAPLKRMSKGMKQKTALVAAFMSHPEILLLDEPSTGLDPLMRDTLIELILKEKQNGATVIMSSHIFKELDDTADRVMFIENGVQKGIVSVSELSGKMPSLYRLGFKNDEDMRAFLERTALDVIYKSEKHLHIDVTAEKDKLPRLFKEMSAFDMRYMKFKPFTLERYYTEVINAANTGLITTAA
ncbi:MAG: ATP-binding cassette domain-containing protein [Ruminococcus sp.]|nr:ATP-binding cassette domain-containing protein [Ruminococcus sp.]MBR1752339.1 ATP-binding cassette domain-containing protein [Ruminococcus sp.]